MKTSSFSFRPSAVETQVQYRAALPRDGRAKRVPTIPRGLPRGTFITLSFCLILIAELLNTALEIVLDRLHPEKHELIGKGKDIASSAVFVAVVFAAITVCVISLSRLGFFLT